MDTVDNFNRKITSPGTYGSHDLSISELTTGIDSKGMDDYMHELYIDILETVANQINDVTAVTTAINNCWQGNSKEKFLEDFTQARELIVTDLKAEYEDLKNRLEELRSFYFEQDQKMMGDGE